MVQEVNVYRKDFFGKPMFNFLMMYMPEKDVTKTIRQEYAVVRI